MIKKVTLQQIADELGTSKTTVSRALNNKSGIGTGLRNKIIEKAKIYGYNIPANNASSLNALAFLVPKRFFLEIDQFYTVIFFHLSHLCQSMNIMLTAIAFTQEEEQAGNLPIQLAKTKFDGIFIVGDSSEHLLASVNSLNMPTVFIDFSKKYKNYCHVLADNYSLGYEVTEYLIEYGHHTIGFVGDYKSNQNICDRYMGYRKALLLNNLPHKQQYDVINNDFRTGLYTINFEMPDEMPSAFVCTCDMAAFYLYEKLRMLDRKIPEDVSVISFDNTEICNNMVPALTSMDIDKSDFANLAFKQMLKLVSSPISSPGRLFVGTNLVVRDSVKKL